MHAPDDLALLRENLRAQRGHPIATRRMTTLTANYLADRGKVSTVQVCAVLDVLVDECISFAQGEQ